MRTCGFRGGVVSDVRRFCHSSSVHILAFLIVLQAGNLFSTVGSHVLFGRTAASPDLFAFFRTFSTRSHCTLFLLSGCTSVSECVMCHWYSRSAFISAHFLRICLGVRLPRQWPCTETHGCVHVHVVGWGYVQNTTYSFRGVMSLPAGMCSTRQYPAQ